MNFLDDISASGRKPASGLSLMQPFLMLVAGIVLLSFIAPAPVTEDVIALEDGLRDDSDMWELVSADPATLTQLLPSEIETLFEKAQLVRQDADASVWQYRSKTCSLNLYFSSEKSGAIAHYTISARKKGETVSEPDCLKSIREEYTIPTRKKKFA
jgi:hypothetical protein